MKSQIKSYDSHLNHLRNYPEDRCKLMLNHDTINRWRYERFYKFLDPLLKAYPNSEWLTVGDFYYGSDAQYLQSKGHKTIASDLDDYFLKQGKETFHHLARPYIGLYEMLRVSKLGVVLLEPYDRNINASLPMIFFEWVLKKIKGTLNNMYETSGNYKYSLSKREIEKIALGLDLPFVAFRYLNDYYKDGLGMETKPMNDKLLKSIKSQILLRDILWKLRLFPPTFLVSIIFKQDVPKDLLEKEGFTVTQLSRNPYL